MSGIFISYRHEGGFEAAQHLAHLLSEDGYIVFFDKKSMRSGKYPEQLYHNIDQCCDFIVILDPNVFNPTLENGSQIKEDDWVPLELAYAIKKEKNIIPVKLSGFSEPGKEKLPEEIRNVFLYHSPLYSKVYYEEGFYNSLVNTLKSPAPIKKRASRIARPLLLFIIVGFIAGLLGYYWGKEEAFKDEPNPSLSHLQPTDTSSLLVIMGGGSVSNYIRKKTGFDLSNDSNYYNRSYKYVYLPMASKKAWSQIGELRSVPENTPNDYRYHLVLFSAKKVDPEEIIPRHGWKNFRDNRGYVEEIKVGQNHLQIAVKKEINIEEYLEIIHEDTVITINRLIDFLKDADSNLMVYSTNKESGTYSKYDSLFKEKSNNSFCMDSIKGWMPFIDGQQANDYTEDHPCVILEVDSYFGRWLDKKDFPRYDVYDENSKTSLTNDLYIYFVVFYDHGKFIIPEIVRGFLKDIGIKMPKNQSDSLVAAKAYTELILNIPPLENELIHSSQK